MRVLISGAGVAGPTLAWFLAKTGAHVTIVEKSRTLLPHGQNVDIKGSAITIIEKMDLMGQIRKFNTTEKGTQFVDSKGRPFAPFPVTEGHSTSFTAEFEILRGDLARILYEAIEDHPNVHFLFGTTVKQVISNSQDAVKVELNNGEVREFDLLVAADGQWSKVRKQCFLTEDVQATHMGMYAVYYTIPRLSADNDYWNIYFALRSRLVSLRPDPHGNIRAMFTYMPRGEKEESTWLAASRSGRQAQGELVKREFSDAGWQTQRILDAMDEAPDFYFHVIEQIKMSKWSNGRVICLGDTAYAPTPLTGMGTSLALIGPYLLAGELGKLAKGEHPARALRAYESAFRSFVEDRQKVPALLPGIAHPETEWGRWAVQALVWSLSKVVGIPWVARRTPDGSGEDSTFPWPHYDIVGSDESAEADIGV